MSCQLRRATASSTPYRLLKAGPELRPRAQALEVLRKLAASSDADLGLGLLHTL